MTLCRAIGRLVEMAPKKRRSSVHSLEDEGSDADFALEVDRSSAAGVTCGRKHPTVSDRAYLFDDDVRPRVAERNDAWRWCSSFLAILSEANLPGPDESSILNLRESLLQFLQAHTLVVNSECSGIGMTEIALATIKTVTSESLRSGDLSKNPIQFSRAGDVDKDCRQALASHGAHSSGCIFGDALHRFGEPLRAKLKISFGRRVREAQLLKAKMKLGKKTRKTLPDVGHAFFKDCISLVMQKTKQYHKKKAYCYVHNCECPVQGQLLQDIFHTPGIVKFVNIGLLCYDWSAAGSRKGTLGEITSCLLAQFCRDRLVNREEVVLAECTILFPEALICGEIGHVYSCTVFKLCPSQAGFPKLRGRKFMLFLLKKRVSWRQEIGDPVDCFMRLWRAPMDGNACAEWYYHAPQGTVNRHIEELARKRHFPDRPCGHKWSYWQIAPPGTRRRIVQHERMLMSNGCGFDFKVPQQQLPESSGGRFQQHGNVSQASAKGWFFDVNQTATYMPPRSRIAPTLMRKTHLWSFYNRRFLLPEESLELMGAGPMFLDKDYNDSDEAANRGPSLRDTDLGERLPLFQDIMSRKYTPTTMRSWAGNGVSVETVGQLLMFIFSGIEFK